jgi:hypothetical protein
LLEKLTRLEQTVVELSRQDSAPRSDNRGRIWRWLVGCPEQPRPLANARLEALRLYAIYFRMAGGAAASDDRETLFSHGFNEDQLREVEGLLLPETAEPRASPGSVSHVGQALRSMTRNNRGA